MPYRLLVFALLVLSWLGLWYHEVIRVPNDHGITGEGTGLMLLMAGATYGVWLRRQSAGLGAKLLLAYGLLMLIGGYLSAPPWAVFDLRTEAERTHYQAHVACALCQLPLVAVMLVNLRKVRQTPRSAVTESRSR